MIFIDYRNIISSQYKIDIFQMPGVIVDYLFNLTGITIDLVRTYVFMGGSTPTQSHFIDSMIKNGYEVNINPQYYGKDRDRPPQEKGTDVALSTRMLALAFTDAYDIAVLVSGDADMLPAIKEIKNVGKRVMVACFEDRAAKIYKEPTKETGSIDFEAFYLDSVIDTIALQAIDDEITPNSVLNEVKNEFFDINIDYDKIKIKRYITYWATRARYLQSCIASFKEEDKDTPHKMFEQLNKLSNERRPGYIKALNKDWTPESWESEIKRIPKTW
jgi:uncharacterized LabA/DUF88 family protein